MKKEVNDLLNVIGPQTFTESDIRIEIQMAIDGPLAAFSAAPRLSPRKIRAHFDLNSPEQVQVKVDAYSFEVISDGVSASDQEKIAELVSERILQSDQFPQIEFTSTVTSIRTECHPFSVVVVGSLLLRGVKKELDLVFKHQNNQLLSHFTLNQSDFNIAPMTSMMGALRCKDELKLSIAITLKKNGIS